MLKPLPAPQREPQPAETIRATLDELSARTTKHTLFGVMFDAERTGLLKRTASLCGVTVERVKEVCDG